MSEAVYSFSRDPFTITKIIVIWLHESLWFEMLNESVLINAIICHKLRCGLPQ